MPGSSIFRCSATNRFGIIWRRRAWKLKQDWEQIRSIYDLLDLAHHPLLLDMIVRTLPRLREGQSINAASLYTAYTNLWVDREEKKERILNRDSCSK